MSDDVKKDLKKDPEEDATSKKLDFGKWLEGQDDDTKTLIDGRFSTLEGALGSERDARRKLEKKLERTIKQQSTDAEKAKKAATEKALAEQEEWQKLAEGRQNEITALEAATEAVSEDLGRYKGALAAHLATQREGLPEHVLTLLDKLDEVEQLEYIAENQEALTPAGDDPPGKKPLPKTPPPSGDGKLSDDERRARAFQVRL